MDANKKESLIKWINVMIKDAAISTLSELKENSTILLKVIKMIDPDLQFSIGTDERNIIYICQYVKDLFIHDVVSEEEILLGNEIEIGKLLCFLLELTLTSANNKESIARIQSLPEHIQTNIMSMTKMVCDNSEKLNLADIMSKMLRKSVSEESAEVSSPYSSAIVSPSKPTALNYLESPLGRSCSSLNSSADNTSPLAAFASSPQALYRRVMVENSKLKQKVRHSEMFLQRKHFDEQLAFDVESEKMEILENNKKLVKDQELLSQKVSDLEDTITKLREEIEFLQLEVGSKDKEIADHVNEIKKSSTTVKQLQDTIDLCSEMELKIQEKQNHYEEEAVKTTALTLKVNKLEQQNSDLKGELVRTKENMEEINVQMQKKKDDYSDQLAHMQEKIVKLEKQVSKQGEQQESLADTLQLDTEISNLKEQNKKLQNTINVQEATIVNMGYETKQISKIKHELEGELESCKTELMSLKSKTETTNESYKKQSNQYMDQISALLKQVDEHTLRNEGLNAKISSTEEKCKTLEKQLEKFEASEKKIHVEIQQQYAELKTKQDKINELQGQVEKEKLQVAEVKKRNCSLESNLKEITNENEQLLAVKREYENLQKRYEGLVSVEIEHKALLEQHDNTVVECKRLKKECDKVPLLEEKCKNLTNMNAGLTSNEIKLAEENIKLKVFEKQCTKLTEENKQIEVLVKRNEELLKENEQIPILVNDCKKLSEENKRLNNVSNENRQLRDENMKIEKLVQENNQLLMENQKIEVLVKENEKLLEEAQKIPVLKDELTELSSQNASLKKTEVELRQAITQNVKMGDVEKECLCLKQEISKLKEAGAKHKRQIEEASRLSDVKYQILLKENERLYEIEKKYKELLDKFNQLSSDHVKASKEAVERRKEFENRLHVMEQQRLELVSKNEQLTAEKQNEVGTAARLEVENKELLKENNNLRVDYNEAVEKNVKHSTTENDKKMADQERLYEAERMKLNKEVNDTVLKYQHAKTLLEENKNITEQERMLNEELSEELREKDKFIEQLENKCLDEQALSKRTAANIRSLEAQLSSSDALIRNLKKEITGHKAVEEVDELKRPNTRSSRKRDINDLSSESDGGLLQMTDLQMGFNTGSKAEEIFQRSRSTRSRNRHSILVLPTTCEETETSDNDEKPMTRTYSLRQKAERRRSFQPRRYMGGNTPPGRRTLIGEPSQVMCAFSTDAEEEPEVMDDMEWGRIALIKESAPEISEEEKNRLRELQRRNTLCLPHLKSSYPMELEVTKEKKDVPEATVKDVQTGKRKIPNDDAPRGTFKKWKTDHALHSSSGNLSKFGRSAQSESNLRRSSRLSPQVQRKEEPSKAPLPQSVSFEITMEPAKNARQRMPRSNASGNLFNTSAPKKLQESAQSKEETGPTGRSTRLKNRETVKVEKPELTTHKITKSAKSEPDKSESNKFVRNDSKRSSFSRATSKMASSFRARRGARTNK